MKASKEKSPKVGLFQNTIFSGGGGGYGGGHHGGYGGGHHGGYGGSYGGGYRAMDADKMPQIPEHSIPQQVSIYHFSHSHEP